MERVVGIGGFFFLADDPNQLSRWYAANLGVEPPPQSYGGEVWMQEAGATVFAPSAGRRGRHHRSARVGGGSTSASAISMRW